MERQEAEIKSDEVENKKKRNRKEDLEEAFAETIASCLQQSHNGLLSPIGKLFEKLQASNENELILSLKQQLQPLGFNPQSPNFSWNSEPDKNQLLNVLMSFQQQLKNQFQLMKHESYEQR